MNEEMIAQIQKLLMTQAMDDDRLAHAIGTLTRKLQQPDFPLDNETLDLLGSIPLPPEVSTAIDWKRSPGTDQPGADLGPAGPASKAPLSFVESQSLAARDKEIAGATNDQLAQLMAQADPSLGITGHDLSLTQLPMAGAWNEQARLSRDIDAMSAPAPTAQTIFDPMTGASGSPRPAGEILDPWAPSGAPTTPSTGSEILDPWAKPSSEAGDLAKRAEQGAANEWMQYGGLAAGLAGTALGVAAPFLERDTEYEDSLKRRAGGDTVARQEMDYAAGQMRRNIMGSAMGRRDISPALAMRNAQMAQSQASSQMMARAAMASAQERQMAENELATIRKQRTGQAIDAGLAGLSQVGAFASSQYAAQKQDARSAQQLKAYQDRTAAMRR